MVHPVLESCDDGDGQALAIGRGADFTCIVTTGGAPRCWGADTDGQSSPLLNAYADMAAGDRHACGLDRAGAPFCWGADDRGQATPPLRPFDALAAGRDFTCGLTPPGGIVCWGDVPFTPPATGSYEQIGAGDRHLCALSSSGAVSCWGANGKGQATPPAGTFDAIAVGTNHGCALAGETVLCWGDDASGQATPPAGIRAATPFAAGSSYSCATDAPTGALRCWGVPPAGAPTGPLDQLALSRWGHDFACGRSAGAPGEVQCWGSPGVPAATPPAINSDTAPDACRTDCQPARCGDGVVDGGESCDDGNTAGGDGCSATCSIE
jgi:cysteine-rich repeat protein